MSSEQKQHSEPQDKTIPIAEQIRQVMEDGCAYSCGCDAPGNSNRCMYADEFAALTSIFEQLEACEERCRKLVGGVKAQILEVAIDRESPFGSDEIADTLGYSRPHVDNELKTLVGLGLLVRFRDDPAGGGKRYSYRLPNVSFPAKTLDGGQMVPDVLLDHPSPLGPTYRELADALASASNQESKP